MPRVVKNKGSHTKREGTTAPVVTKLVLKTKLIKPNLCLAICQLLVVILSSKLVLYCITCFSFQSVNVKSSYTINKLICLFQFTCIIIPLCSGLYLALMDINLGILLASMFFVNLSWLTKKRWKNFGENYWNSKRCQIIIWRKKLISKI